MIELIDWGTVPSVFRFKNERAQGVSATLLWCVVSESTDQLSLNSGRGTTNQLFRSLTTSRADNISGVLTPFRCYFDSLSHLGRE